MLSEADRAVLDESFQNTRMAGEAIHMVIGKVEDEDLALDLNRQACRFLQFEEKLQQMYAREHETPPRDHVVDKTMLWSGIQMNTLMDGRYDDPGKYKRHDSIDEDGQGKPDCSTGIL